jgi:Immunity protein 53
MASMMDAIAWLETWYAAQCDGDWEHSYGIRIDTLDNPGWSVEIDLADTELGGLIVQRVRHERSEFDWISYEVREGKFIGHSGPRGLHEILTTFRGLVESSHA